MADSTTHIDTIATSQADKETTANGFFDAGSAAAQFGRRQSTSEALTWGYYGGRIGSSSVANGTVTLTASRVNFIVAHKTTGAVTASIDGSNWCTPQTYARLYKVTTSTVAVTSYQDYRFGRGGVFGNRFGSTVQDGRIEIPIQVGDVSTAITTGTTKASVRAPCAFLLTDVRLGLATASSSGNPAFDVNDGGDSIFATTLTVDANETTSTTAATAHVLKADAGVIADDARITVDIDTAGTGAAGPTIWLIGERGVGDPGWDLVKSALTLEGSNGGTTFTDAVSGRTWTRTGATTSTAQSVNGTFANYAASSALFGSGGTDSLRSDASADWDLTTAHWSISFWVRATSLANTPLLVTVGDSATNRLNIWYSGSAIEVYSVIGASSAARITGANLSTGTWYFVELATDLITMGLYLDGVSQGTYTGDKVPTGTLQCDLGNYVYSPSSTYVLNGHMQRFRFTRGWYRHGAAYSRPPKPWPTY